MKIIKLNEPEYIKDLLARDTLYKDFWPNMDNFELMYPDMTYTAWFELTKGYATLGVMYLKEHTDNCVYFHGGLFKDYRNKNTPKILKECLSYFHSILPGYVFATTVNSNNTKVIRLLKAIGCVHQATIKNGYKTGDLMIFSEVE